MDRKNLIREWLLEPLWNVIKWVGGVFLIAGIVTLPVIPLVLAADNNDNRWLLLYIPAIILFGKSLNKDK